jgi:glycosyltransferase involved in cell wall biosynthesis
MRILFITAHSYLPQRYDGGVQAVNQLCHGLLTKGHQVSVLAGLTPEGAFGLKVRLKGRINAKLAGCKIARSTSLGYPVWYAWFPWEAVEYVVRKERPDLIVVTVTQPVRMALAARKTNTPILMLLQDVEFREHGGAFEELGQVPCVANSNFTATKYRNAFGVSPSVIYPFIDAAKYKTDTSRTNITFINPHPVKGRDIAIEIARQCPEIPFAFVESWPLSPDFRSELFARIKGIPNITFKPTQIEMRNIYGDCKILLAPSVWEEAYGRVVTEAQVSGIPVVASTKGGLPEAVGAGGVLLDPNQPISDWIAAVLKLWRDDGYYGALSAAARAHATMPELSFDYQIDAFEHAMRGAVSPDRARNLVT